MAELPLHCICGYQTKIDRLEVEIEHLRRMTMNLVDELRQNGGYEAYTPEMLFQEFYDEAHRGDR